MRAALSVRISNQIASKIFINSCYAIRAQLNRNQMARTRPKNLFILPSFAQWSINDGHATVRSGKINAKINSTQHINCNNSAAKRIHKNLHCTRCMPNALHLLHISMNWKHKNDQQWRHCIHSMRTNETRIIPTALFRWHSNAYVFSATATVCVHVLCVHARMCVCCSLSSTFIFSNDFVSIYLFNLIYFVSIDSVSKFCVSFN